MDYIETGNNEHASGGKEFAYIKREKLMDAIIKKMEGLTENQLGRIYIMFISMLQNV